MTVPIITQTQTNATLQSITVYGATYGGTGAASIPITWSTGGAWGAGSSTATWPSGGGPITWTVYDQAGNIAADYTVRDTLEVFDGQLVIPEGRALVIAMRDGSKIVVDGAGNYRVEDAAAKVTYKANRNLEFNPYLNASDLLARFIRSLGADAVRRSDVPTLPLALFINWLVLEAAQQDEMLPPDDVVPPIRHRLLVSRIHPRCMACQRFVRRAIAAQGFVYCNPDHAARHYARMAAA